MNALTKIESTALSAMSESEVLEVLQNSLYPGANPNSIRMVLGYCKATGLDPMQKPVHIVPMWDSKAKQMRDVVMPGIGLYRTQAARTGEHVGTDEPVFGPMVEMRVGDFVLQHPEWCKVTVYRMVGGVKCAYTAAEYWVENYATAGKDTTAPNTMWKKRTRGQIAKCAEAQALRKGFPEVGNQPTAEEMEGKVLGEDDLPRAPRGGSDAAPTIKHMGAAEVVTPAATAAPAAPTLPAFPDEDFQRGLPVWRKAAGKLPVAEVLARAEAANPGFAFTEQQKAAILSLKKAEPDAPTFASVADAINKAKNIDALSVAGDLIGAVADEQQRGELRAMYQQREQSMTVEG
jgi:phage recombination protein Bet